MESAAYFSGSCACMIKRAEAILPNCTTYKFTTWMKEPSESIEVQGEHKLNQPKCSKNLGETLTKVGVV